MNTEAILDDLRSRIEAGYPFLFLQTWEEQRWEAELAELRRRMPDVALVPFPVVTDKMRSEAWWSSPPTAKLLFSEYLKYIVAQVRFRLGTTPDVYGSA